MPAKAGKLSSGAAAENFPLFRFDARNNRSGTAGAFGHLDPADINNPPPRSIQDNNSESLAGSNAPSATLASTIASYRSSFSLGNVSGRTTRIDSTRGSRGDSSADRR